MPAVFSDQFDASSRESNGDYPDSLTGVSRSSSAAACSADLCFQAGPFECKVTGQLPVEFTGGQPAITLKPNKDLEFVYDSDLGGFQRLVLTGRPTLEAKVASTVTVGTGGKLVCEWEVGVLPFSLAQPIGLVVSLVVPFGVGLELSGKITAAKFGLSAIG